MKAQLFKAVHAADILVIDKASVEHCHEMGELALVRLDGGTVLEFKDQEVEINPLGFGSVVDVEDVKHRILFQKVVPMNATHLAMAEIADSLMTSVMTLVASIRKKEN